MQKEDPIKDPGLLDRFAKNVHDGKLLQKGASCLLAVSGGMDSVVMLSLFTQIATPLRLKLAVVHVNHGIRALDADQDEIFVQNLAKQYDLPFHSTKVDAGRYSKQEKLSPEGGARALRYDFFEQVLKQTGFDFLATAHTKNDQVETVLDHFLRGSGSTGLRGILPKRDSFIRPLLNLTKRELKSYADKHKLVYREDASNDDLSFRRNRIRHELIPYLEKHFNHGLTESLDRSSQIFRETEFFLKSSAAEACKSLVSLQEKNEIILDIEGFLGYNKLVQKYILMHCCGLFSKVSGIENYNRLDEVVSLIESRNVGKRCNLSDGLTVMVDHDGIFIGSLEVKPLPRVELDLVRGNRVKYGGFLLKWSIGKSCKDPKENTEPKHACVDLSKTGSNLVVRGFYAGAYFYPLNLGGKKKVSAYFSDNKVPVRHRSHIPILESPKGIVWICGHQIDDRFKVSTRTRRILTLELSNITDG